MFCNVEARLSWFSLSFHIPSFLLETVMLLRFLRTILHCSSLDDDIIFIQFFVWYQSYLITIAVEMNLLMLLQNFQQK